MIMALYYCGNQLAPRNYSANGEYKVDKFFKISDLILEDDAYIEWMLTKPH